MTLTGSIPLFLVCGCLLRSAEGLCSVSSVPTAKNFKEKKLERFGPFGYWRDYEIPVHEYDYWAHVYRVNGTLVYQHTQRLGGPTEPCVTSEEIPLTPIDEDTYQLGSIGKLKFMVMKPRYFVVYICLEDSEDGCINPHMSFLTKIGNKQPVKQMEKMAEELLPLTCLDPEVYDPQEEGEEYGCLPDEWKKNVKMSPQFRRIR